MGRQVAVTQAKRLGESSGLLAGVTAATIWMAISLWVGMPTQAAGMWAVIFLVATTLVAAVLASVIGRGARASS